MRKLFILSAIAVIAAFTMVACNSGSEGAEPKAPAAGTYVPAEENGAAAGKEKTEPVAGEK